MEKTNINHGCTWEVRNFTKLDQTTGVNICSQFSSGIFNEYSWSLELYPGGCDDKNKEYVSIHLLTFNLVAMGISKPVYIIISLIDDKKEESVIVKRYVKMQAFQEERRFDQFVKRDFLLDDKNGLLPNDKLTIRCKIYEHPHVVENLSPAIDALKEASAEFEGLLSSKKFSDFKIVVGKDEFHVHKNILSARSRVFSRMLNCNMLEKDQNSMEIDDFDSDVVKEVLRYIYAGNVEGTKTLAMELLAAADKYELDGLKAVCERTLLETLSVDNAIEVLVLADLHKADNLKRRVKQFTVDHAKEIITTEKYNTIMASHPFLLLQVINELVLKRL